MQVPLPEVVICSILIDMASPVNQPTPLKPWAWVLSFFRKPPRQNPIMQEVDPSKMTVFSCAGIERSGYSSYPIFSLHKSDTEMIEQYRAIVKELNIPCQEIDLPGPTEPEVGFVVAYNDTRLIGGYMLESNLTGTILWDQFDSWFETPFMTLMPDGVTIPRCCYIPIIEMLEERVNWTDVDDEEDTFLILNVPTNEVVKATVNYKEKTYHLSGGVTGWIHVATLPDL